MPKAHYVERKDVCATLKLVMRVRRNFGVAKVRWGFMLSFVTKINLFSDLNVGVEISQPCLVPLVRN